jgi:hypothetical protein
MGIFELLEETALALWVGESLWGYPIMLSLHAVGLSIVVGIFTMLNLRILGLLKDIELSAFKSLYQISWAGLAINAISGFSLFSSQATYFVTSKPFLIKITAIILGVIVAIFLYRCLYLKDEDISEKKTIKDQSTRNLAVLSLLCWTTAIFSGRLVAYL